MNSIQVAAYLRAACSVLNFDIGELWIAKKIAGQRPTLKFIQLYTSPTYEDFHSLLIRPDAQHESMNDDEKHRISPIICRGVCDGGQIVWASTLILEGLIGRKELPLNTAVGMPICSIGQDLGIMVLFAVEPIAISPNAIEFLGYLSRAASENIAGFIPPSLTTPVSPANVEQFVGIWDIFELIKKYSSDISFHILPIGPLQSFFDYQESMAFKDIFDNSANESLLTSSGRDIDYNQTKSSEFKQVLDTKSFADFSLPMDSMLQNGTYSIAYSNLESKSTDDISLDDESRHSNHHNNHHHNSNNNNNSIIMDDDLNNQMVSDLQTERSFSVDARESYRKSPSRFHELMIALLGMTIFDAAELWMLSEKTQDLHVTAALHRDGIMQMWTTQGRNLKLKRGQDVPGRVMDTSQPFWENKYDHKQFDQQNFPRAVIASQIGVRTALGIPLPGYKGTCGALTLYSRSEVDVEPLIATFVTKATQLISASAIGTKALSREDIETLIFNPTVDVTNLIYGTSSTPKLNLLDSNPGGNSLALTKSNMNRFSVKVQMMGSLAQDSKTSYRKSDNNSKKRHTSHGSSTISSGSSDGNSSPSVLNKSLSDTLLEAAEFVLNGNLVRSDKVLHEIPIMPFAAECKVMPDVPRRGKRNRMIPSSTSSSSSIAAASAFADSQRLIAQLSSPRSRSDESNDFDMNDNNTLSDNGRQNYQGLSSGGTRRCQFEGCTKCAQGATKYCIGHGGGRRCTYAGCMKGARDKFFCAGHGGGKRCSVTDCTKSAVGGSIMCTLHGGGKRCTYPGCSKSSQSSTNFCVKHGGGRKCSITGCNKVSRGRTDFCAAHGGGIRCIIDDCNKSAVGKYRLCRHHQSTLPDIDTTLKYLFTESDDRNSINSFPSSEDNMLDEYSPPPKRRSIT